MQPELLSKIQLLPKNIIDKIKAGEVVERPANILKELLENSIDAGATQIAIQIKKNGLEKISVIDDGYGIPFEQLPLAFTRHATSKLTQFEDLYKIRSYGFRGEALASIASICKIKCYSTCKNSATALLEIAGGEQINHLTLESDSLPIGTQIFITDLFYNTPARFKFLQAEASEKNRLKKIFFAFCISMPEITFSIQWDDKEKIIYQRRECIEDRLFDILKRKDFYLKKNTYDGIDLCILAGKETSKSAAHKTHNIFINNRLVFDKTIHQIIINKMQQIWGFGNHSHYICSISMKPQEIDVNVHPAKTLIKCFQPNRLYSLIAATIDQILPETGPSPSDPRNHQPNNQHYQSEQTLSDLRNDAFQAHRIGHTNNTNGWLYHMISHSYLLIKEHTHSLLCHIPSLVHWHLEHGSNTITPKLIATPLPGELNFQERQILINLGIEIEKIGNEHLHVIRSCTEKYDFYPIYPLINFLLKKISIQQFIEEVGSDKVFRIYQNCPKDLLMKNRSLFLVSDTLLDRIFYE